MSEPKEIIQKWVDAHDELELDGKTINHGSFRVGTFRGNGRCSIGPEDGGVRGEIVRVDEDSNHALIVDGDRVAWDHGRVSFEGKFAIWPWQPGRPEIDGPIPE